MQKNMERYLQTQPKRFTIFPFDRKIVKFVRVESMIKAGIIGATGYAGAELVRLLLGHKEVEIKWYGSRSYVDQGVCIRLSEYVPAGG